VPVPTAICPECGRAIPVTAAEVRSGLILECAGCDTRFPATPTAEMVPQAEARPRATLTSQLTLFIVTCIFTLIAACIAFYVWERSERQWRQMERFIEEKSR
jgi:hypothetical protein